MVTLSEPIARFAEILSFCASRGITDVYLKPGKAPLYRRAGLLISRKDEAPYTAEQLAKVASRTLQGPYAARFKEDGDARVVWATPDGGRFRVRVYRQRRGIAMSVRVCRPFAASARELGMPEGAVLLAGGQRGLLVIASGAGGGRTTTLAGVIEQLNTSDERARHVLKIEGPAEFDHEDQLAWVCQREVGADVATEAEALQAALDLGVDVLAVDDWRAPESLAAMVEHAEAGRLVVATVLAEDVPSSLGKLLGHATAQDPSGDLQRRLLDQLNGVIAQRLVPTLDRSGVQPIVEVLVQTPQTHQLLAHGANSAQLVELMAQGRVVGMNTYDQALNDKLADGVIHPEVAAMHARKGHGRRRPGQAPLAGGFAHGG